MRAAVYDRVGRAGDVLSLVDLPDPEPGPGEVLVRIAFSAINPSDIKSRSGWSGQQLPKGGIIPHQDGAGSIVAVGTGVDRARLGQQVWLYEAAAGLYKTGTAAELCAIPSEQAIALPEGVGLDMGACLGVPAMTAHRCVFGHGSVSGQHILVSGGAGSVGRFAVQLARWGLASVTATAGSEAQIEVARAAGAQVVLSYRAPDLLDQLRRVAPGGFSRIIEVALAQNLATDAAASAPGGTIVAFASAGDAAQAPLLPERILLLKALCLQWVHVYTMPEKAKRAAIADISLALTQGSLTLPPVDRYRLDQIAEAHDAVGLSGAGRKALIAIGEG